MLKLKLKLGHGHTRDCWLHPADGDLCVKTVRREKGNALSLNKIHKIFYSIRHLRFKTEHEDIINDMRREAEIYKAINKLLPGRVAEIHENLIEIEIENENEKGLGLVCELVKNYDGSAASSLDKYFKAGCDTQKLLTGLNWIAKRIIARDIFLFDLNRGNFAVKTLSNNKIIIVIIDIKSLNRTGNQGFLHLERILAPLARIVMYRRLKRLYKDLNLKFNFNKLCRMKLLSNFIVSIRI